MRSSSAGTALLSSCAIGVATGQEASPPIACQVVRTRSNPFFDDMVKATQARANASGIDLRVFETFFDASADASLAAQSNALKIKQCVDAGAKGILLAIDPDVAGSSYVRPAIDAAKEQGVLVIALDSPLAGANAIFMTDNTNAGYKVGEWTLASEPNPQNARVTILSCPLSFGTHIFERLAGFIDGFNLQVQYTPLSSMMFQPVIDFSTDDRVIFREFPCNSISSGKDTMLSVLEEQEPGDNRTIIVYATNEVGAHGALQALKEKGVEDGFRIVTIDGSCEGVAEVYSGGFSANAIQHPDKMGELGIDAINAWIVNGTKPVNIDTGVELAAASQIGNITSLSVDDANSTCWGAVDGSYVGAEGGNVSAGGEGYNVTPAPEATGGGGGTPETSGGNVAYRSLLIVALSAIAII